MDKYKIFNWAPTFVLNERLKFPNEVPEYSKHFKSGIYPLGDLERKSTKLMYNRSCFLQILACLLQVVDLASSFSIAISIFHPPPPHPPLTPVLIIADMQGEGCREEQYPPRSDQIASPSRGQQQVFIYEYFDINIETRSWVYFDNIIETRSMVFIYEYYYIIFKTWSLVFI